MQYRPNPCYRNNLVVVQYEADITFHKMCYSSIKNQLKAPSNRRNFAIYMYKENGVKDSNSDVRIFTGTAHIDAYAQ